MSDQPPTPSDESRADSPSQGQPPAPSQAENDATTSTSTKLDYELLRLIGRGAYGEVWLARDKTGAYRAVKVVFRESFDHDRPYEREFEGIRKFEPVSRSYDNQVQILHVGRQDDKGRFYYIMELADDQKTGQKIDPEAYEPKTLRSEMKQRGRLPVSECLRIGAALAGALENLHEHGLIHRDIKPGNIIFVNGVAKLADIGLVTDRDVTVSYVGTEGYIPPEGPSSAQADIFSLGKVLYEMATGRDRMDFPELPTDLEERPDRDALLELNAVIAKACARDPKQRYRSARAMFEDLACLQRGEPIRGRSRRRWLAGAKVVAGLTFIAVMVWGIQYIRKIQPQGTTRRSDPAPTGTNTPTTPTIAPVLQGGSRWTNGLGMVFVPVPGNEVWFSRWETRVKDFSNFVFATQHDMSGDMWVNGKVVQGHNWLNPGFRQQSQPGEHPVVGVSWNDAQAFCRWLSEADRKKGLLAPTERYRLPRYDEWQTAVDRRGKFSWGDQWPPPTNVANIAGQERLDDGLPHKQVLDGHRDGYPWTAPVGSFLPNGYGLFDMHGNVGEWCEDKFDNRNRGRILGGAWIIPDSGQVSGGVSFMAGPDARSEWTGFRIVLERKLEVTRSAGKTVSTPQPSEPVVNNTGPSKAPVEAPTTGGRWTNSLGMIFVPVPGTKVLFSIWETRVRDFEEFLHATGYDTGNRMRTLEKGKWDWRTGHSWRNPGFKQNSSHPVVGVSWSNAVAFCRWLTQKEQDRLMANHRYRLPRDAEWSAAAGLKSEQGTTPAERHNSRRDTYVWGNNWPPRGRVGNLGGEEAKDQDWHTDGVVISGYNDGFARTAPVGSFPANAYGIHDLEGNVCEWMEDYFNGTNGGRVLRLGSWFSMNAKWCSLSYRSHEEADFLAAGTGFRVVVENPTANGEAHSRPAEGSVK